MVSNDADSIKRVNSREEAVWLLNLDFALGGILNRGKRTEKVNRETEDTGVSHWSHSLGGRLQF